ncbi:MAG TPA: tRNA-specific adenosine deaminase [Deltaproteobacteria bacterium]|nr:MAG: tRNA-specific adenosine deaminase [Deltaproteobacteria bacterium GWA2_45_12]HBF12952.1 tRNA-specific adenosine deaminase [Deltaproteobacteria bacterium]
MDTMFMKAALDEAFQGLKEGGIPIGSVLTINEKIVGRGHNRRVQSGNPILHGEMDCLQNAGRLKAKDYQRATLYTTLSPCDMCTGTIKIPRVVMAENTTFRGGEDLLLKRGVEVINMNVPEAITLMRNFIKAHPELWNEDIGV